MTASVLSVLEFMLRSRPQSPAAGGRLHAHGIEPCPRPVGADHRAQDEFARADHCDAQAWVRFFGVADLHASIGIAQSSIGEPTDAELTSAIEHITCAIDRRGPDMTRSRTFELIALSVAYLRGGNREHGLRIGHDAAASATTVRSIRTLDRLKPLQDLITQRASDVDCQTLAQRIKSLRAAE